MNNFECGGRYVNTYDEFGDVVISECTGCGRDVA